MNPEQIGKQIAEQLLMEDFTEKVALYPGAFKPPHKGHFETALRAMEGGDVDRVIIFMSSKERDGISVQKAQDVWDLYKATHPELQKIEVVQTPTPVKDVYDFVKNNPTSNIRAVFGKGEEERYKSLATKYSNVEIFDAGMVGNFSATDLRQAIRDNDLEKISTFLPEGVNVDDFMLIFQLNENIKETYNLDIPKFNQPKTIQQYLIESIKEIKLSKENAVEIDGDLTGGMFIVGDITYEYSIKNIPNPYKDLGLFYNIQFTPEEEMTSIPQMGKENYIKILSTMYKIIVDFIERKKPEYVGIVSLDNKGKNYHKVYANLTDNRYNNIPGYFRKDVSLEFTTPEGKGKFIVLKRKEEIEESIVGNKIICDNCGWNWKIIDGGDDLFICHKCGHDNEPITEETLKEIYEINSNLIPQEKFAQETGKDYVKDALRNIPQRDRYNIENYKVVTLPLDKIKPTQFGEDYINASSEYEAEQYQKYLKGEIGVEDLRKEDFYPIIIDKDTMEIIDGNHRHAVHTMLDIPKIKAILVPKNTNENKYLREARYKKFLNEGWDNSKAKTINTFITYCSDYLSVDRPKIKLVNSPEYTQEYHSFGGYLPSEYKIVVVVHNRNMADILRTLAHEMVHHMQNLDKRLEPTSGEDGSPDENEANSLAGIIMRQFGRENPHIYE